MKISYPMELDALVKRAQCTEKLSLILGNSGSPTNNHLDACTIFRG